MNIYPVAQYSGIFFGKQSSNNRVMEVTAVVLHEGALAHYEVNIGQGGICTAFLSNYRGLAHHAPPQRITLHKEGRHWVSDNGDNTLSEDLGYAVELKARPILEERKRNDVHPAG